MKEPRQKSWQHADSFQPCFDACGIARHVNPLIIGTSGQGLLEELTECAGNGA